MPSQNFNSYSLFDYFTLFNENNGSTDLIRFLIRVVALNACSAKRNTFAHYRLVEIFRELLNRIEALITKADDVSGTDDWDAYDKYTAAIDPLEKLLYLLVEYAEPNEYLGKTTSIADLLNSIQIWEESRKGLRGLVERCEKDINLQGILPIIPSEDLRNERIYDDLTLLSTLCDGIINNKLEDRDVIGGKRGKYITNLKSDATAIALTAISSEDSIFQSIRCIMLVHGAMALDSPDIESVKMSQQVWDQAEVLLRSVVGLLSHKPSVTVNNLKDGWNELKRRLENLEATLPPEYLELRKLAKSVRRPYHARTLALVNMCKLIANHFSGLSGRQRTVKALFPLKLALDAATDAIQRGRDASTSIGQISEDISQTEAGVAFAEAARKVNECLVQYNLQPLLSMDEALKRDRERTEQLNDNFEKLNCKQRPSLPSDPKRNIEVVVSCAGAKSKTYTVDRETLLSVILWKFMSDYPALRKKLPSMIFKKDGSVVGCDMKIASVIEKTPSVTSIALTLVHSR